jgi:hypothetical protein
MNAVNKESALQLLKQRLRLYNMKKPQKLFKKETGSKPFYENSTDSNITTELSFMLV